MRQVSIFEIINPIFDKTIEQMTIGEVAEAIGNALGLNFLPDTRWSSEFNNYIAEPKKNTIVEVGISRYKTLDNRNGKAFISVGYFDNYSGFGAPCDSINEAISHLKRYTEANE